MRIIPIIAEANGSSPLRRRRTESGPGESVNVSVTIQQVRQGNVLLRVGGEELLEDGLGTDAVPLQLLLHDLMQPFRRQERRSAPEIRRQSSVVGRPFVQDLAHGGCHVVRGGRLERARREEVFGVGLSGERVDGGVGSCCCCCCW